MEVEQTPDDHLQAEEDKGKQADKNQNDLSAIIEEYDSGWGDEIDAANELSKITKKDTFINFFDQEQAEPTIPKIQVQNRISDLESPNVPLKSTFIGPSTSPLIKTETSNIKIENISKDLSKDEETKLQVALTSGGWDDGGEIDLDKFIIEGKEQHKDEQLHGKENKDEKSEKGKNVTNA